MATDFIPKRDADLLAFSVNFNTLINADPTIYGLDLAQAGAYTALHDAFAAALAVTTSDATRTPSSIVAKNDARDALEDGPGGIRQLAAIIQAFPGTTNEMRSDLGLTVRDTEPTPVPVPETSPILSILSTLGRTVKIRLRDADSPTNRGKPASAIGATLLSFVGEDPPADTLDWSFLANTGRTQVELDFPATIAAGSKVWITAFWFNSRKESGNAAAPQSTRLSDGLAQSA